MHRASVNDVIYGALYRLAVVPVGAVPHPSEVHEAAFVLRGLLARDGNLWPVCDAVPAPQYYVSRLAYELAPRYGGQWGAPKRRRGPALVVD